MMQRREEISDVVWIGWRGVGKTALLQRILGRAFDAKYAPTPSTETFLTSALGGYEIKVWDTCGTDSVTLTDSSLPRKACLLVLVYDVSDGYSFQYLEQCLPSLRNLRPMCPAVLVGTKADVATKSVVPARSAHSLASKYQCEFVQTSAKTPDLLIHLLTAKLYRYSEVVSTAVITRKRSRCCLTSCLSWIWNFAKSKPDGDGREPLNMVRSSTPSMQKLPLTEWSARENAFESRSSPQSPPAPFTSANSLTKEDWHIAAGVILSSYELRNQKYIRVSHPRSVVQAVYDTQQKLPWIAELDAPNVCTVAELWYTMTESKLQALSTSDPYTRNAIGALFAESIQLLCNNMECITQHAECEQPSLRICRIFWQLFIYLQFKSIPLWYHHTQEYVTVARAVPGLEAIEIVLESEGTQTSLRVSWSHCATIRSYGLSLRSTGYNEFQHLPGWYMAEGEVVGGSVASVSSRNASPEQGSIVDLTARELLRQEVPIAIDPLWSTLTTIPETVHPDATTAGQAHHLDPPVATTALQLQLPTVIKFYAQSVHNNQHWVFARVRWGNGREGAQDFPAAEFVTLPGAEMTCPTHIWDMIKTRRGLATNL